MSMTAHSPALIPISLPSSCVVAFPQRCRPTRNVVGWLVTVVMRRVSLGLGSDVH